MEKKSRHDIFSLTRPYQTLSLKKSLWQIANTFIPILSLMYLAFIFSKFGFIYTIPFTLLISLFIVRIFCMQHDFGHNALFASKAANELCGMICNIFTLTPFHYFRYYHAQHHINIGKIEQSGHAELFLLTTEQYLELNNRDKIKYRIIRHPLTIIFLIPTYIILSNLFPYIFYDPRYRKKIISASLSSFGIILIYFFTIYLTNSVEFFVYVLLPAIYLATMIGVYFFYFQHNFSGNYFESKEAWDHMDANLKGSSCCLMPKIMEWFSLSIGFHYLHHLNPRIPNYNLSKCHFDNSCFHELITTFNLSDSWKTLFANLYDTNKKNMIRFKEIK